MHILPKITKLFGNVLYYPGCVMKYVTIKQNENYKRILRKLNVDFIQLAEQEVCCGSPVLKAGYDKEYAELARKNFELFEKHAVKRIITPCPACAHALSNYKNVIKAWDIEVENAVTFIARKLVVKEEEVKKLKKSKSGKVTFHDPCHLSRYQGIYAEPREILKRCGLELAEMWHNKEFSFCCGGGGGFRANNPKIARKIAKIRIKEATESGAEEIITCCPLCFVHLKENSAISVSELSDILIKVLE